MEKYYWLILIGFLVVVYIFMIVRQRKQQKKSVEALNSFKVGDKVITHIGIYGRIKRIYNTSFGKTCVLEIGNNNKVDIEIDMRYIAGLDEKVLVADEPKEEKPATEHIEQQKQNEDKPLQNEVPKQTKNNKNNQKRQKK